MQQFLLIIRTAKDLRTRVENELGDAFMSFLMASAWLSDAEVENALSSPQATIELDVETKSVMGVKIPFFKLKKEGIVRNYGYAQTNTLLDTAIDSFDSVFALLIELAQIEKQAENMAIELETTRRRVNGLEHKIIPDMKQTVKYIKMRLDESERAGIIATMRIKAGMEAAEAQALAAAK